MPIPEDKRNTNGLDKNPQNINKKGRPKKIYTILKETGYSKDDIRTIFLELPLSSLKELKSITKNKKAPALVLIVAKAIERAINKGDYNQIKDIIEQVIGKSPQHITTEQDITEHANLENYSTKELITRANAIKKIESNSKDNN